MSRGLLTKSAKNVLERSVRGILYHTCHPCESRKARRDSIPGEPGAGRNAVD